MPTTVVVNSPYAPDFKLAPGTEVDYGVFWTSDGVPGYRVSYIQRERKVIATKPNDGEWVVLASDIDFAVVEILLTRPYSVTSEALVNRPASAPTTPGWATACNRGADIEWVARRLRSFKWGSDIVSYRPKAGTDRWTAEGNALAKAVRHHAWTHNIRAVGGGWYRTRDGLGRSYAQGYHDYVSVSRSTMLNLGVSTDGTYRWAVAK